MGSARGGFGYGHDGNARTRRVAGNDVGGAARHLRLLAWHGVRVVMISKFTALLACFLPSTSSPMFLPTLGSSSPCSRSQQVSPSAHWAPLSSGASATS